MDIDYDLMISELYQTQHECYMLAMALNNVVELVPVYEHPLQPSGAGEALLIQQVTDALVNANITPSYEGLLESAWDLVVKFIRKLGEYFKKICDWISEHIKKWFSKKRTDKLDENRAFIMEHREIYDKYMNNFTISQEAVNPISIPPVFTQAMKIDDSDDVYNTKGEINPKSHVIFSALQSRLSCIRDIMRTIERDVSRSLDQANAFTSVEVDNIMNGVYSCDVTKKTDELQTIVDRLGDDLTTLHNAITELNENRLERGPIDSGWDTARSVDRVVNDYHDLEARITSVTRTLSTAAKRLSGKSLVNIRVLEHIQSLQTQTERTDFTTYLNNYAAACQAMLATVRSIHTCLTSISADMEKVFGSVEQTPSRLRAIIKQLRATRNDREGKRGTFDINH